MSKGPQSHHIVPNRDGGWDVKRGGASRASSRHETKREAVNAGRKVSRTQGTELRIHAAIASVAAPIRRKDNGSVR